MEKLSLQEIIQILQKKHKGIKQIFPIFKSEIHQLKKQNLTGILFPALNEFSFPAALETVSKLPDHMILAGGYEIMASMSYEEV